jgi:hypothetical protein
MNPRTPRLSTPAAPSPHGIELARGGAPFSLGVPPPCMSLPTYITTVTVWQRHGFGDGRGIASASEDKMTGLALWPG